VYPLSQPVGTCHHPHEEGRRSGGGRCAVGWLFLLTDLSPPRVGRGSHPPPLEVSGEGAGSMAGQVPSQQEETGS
jgi:hypothetical protein